MATIGTFTRTDHGFTGSISTLTLRAAAVSFVPLDAASNPNGPSFRIYHLDAEIGVAWTRRSKDKGKTYYSCKLDDPSFPGPVFANLVEHDDGSLVLLWDRPRTRRSTDEQETAT